MKSLYENEYAGYDAVTVLGGGLCRDADGEYRPTTFADRDQFGMLGGEVRVAAALALYMEGATQTVMFSTGVSEKQIEKFGFDVPPEAAVYKRVFEHLLDEAVDQSAQARLRVQNTPPRLLEEDKSVNSASNLKEVMKIARAQKVSELAIVSNEFHVPRVARLHAKLSDVNPDWASINTTFLAAEPIAVRANPDWTAEVLTAYASEAARIRAENEARGLRDLDGGAYHFGEFQNAPNAVKV